MKRHFPTIALLATLAVPSAVLAFEEPEDLPEGLGREETFYMCTACHSFTLVANQGMGRPLWDDTFQFMIDRQGMSDPGPEERALIVDYLAYAYPARRTQRGWTNPFMPPPPPPPGSPEAKAAAAAAAEGGDAAATEGSTAKAPGNRRARPRYRAARDRSSLGTGTWRRAAG